MPTAFSDQKRALAIGVATGVVVGSVTAWRAKRVAVLDRKPGMIDWERVRSIAVSMNREAALTQAERSKLDREYADLTDLTVPIVAAYTTDSLPRDRPDVFAFDRVDWINANIDAFRQMFQPIERLNLLGRGDGTKPIRALWNNMNQTVLSAEIGFMLGYLGRRVLGQYDLSLLGREPIEGGGKLYFVHPNIVNVERSLGVPSDQFRLWLALHETTHAFEFEAHPWLRDHMNSLLERYISYLADDVEYLQKGLDALRLFWERARSGPASGNSWIEMVMSAEQRSIFSEMQALMAVVEGYSNHVMNAVGKDLLPDYQVIHQRFQRRQAQRSPAEQIFARLTGLDLKLEQYRLGESFIDGVAALRGHHFARKVWEGPETLPTMEELRDPESWVARIDAATAQA